MGQTPQVTGTSAKVAVLVIRNGRLPAGVAQLVEDATDVVAIGTGVMGTVADLNAGSAHLWGWETGEQSQDRWISPLSTSLSHLGGIAGPSVIVLSAGPDGRGIGPGLAHALGWPFIAGAIEAGPGRATQLLPDGMTVQELAIDGPFVATVECGASSMTAAMAPSSDTAPLDHPPLLSPLPGMVNPAVAVDPTVTLDPAVSAAGQCAGAVLSLGELPAVVATMDLVDAERIVAAGAGLGDSERLALLSAVGERMGAAMGATRVLADRGWISHRRQIGTTGVAVNPRLYLAFGISGASQHTAGLGQPDHVVSVNVDASCPMMAMADLAVVADAPAVLDELARLLGVDAP